MNQQFGGPWTGRKLDVVSAYLKAYANVLKNQHHLRKHYIDAFAGTGYVELQTEVADNPSFLDDAETAEEEARQVLSGSASLALEIDPPFDSYTFIERSSWRAKELARLQHSCSDLAGSITIRQEDANTALQSICASWNRTRDRAVVFLDPFGMSVEWATLQAIAATESMDVWYLFPLSTVNRLLPRETVPPAGWERKLNSFFGTADWRTSFYTTKQEETLFGMTEETTRTADIDGIRDFAVTRLKEIFPVVVQNPLLLKTPAGKPLFLLCFAASNPHGTAGEIADRIASHILRNA